MALSGTPAGDTAICTVGQSGNDLHYRGYDIADLAAHCEFAEVAYLLIHGKLPNRRRAGRLQRRAFSACAALPAGEAGARTAAAHHAHPMDVLRTGVSVLGCVRPEADDHNDAGARDIADGLLASLPSMLLYWHHYARNGKRIAVDAGQRAIWPRIFCICCTAGTPSAEWIACHAGLADSLR